MQLTRFPSGKIKNDPGSEEQQGKNLVDAAIAAGVVCFIWSTLPSSHQISGGRLVSRIYEGIVTSAAVSSQSPANPQPTWACRKISRRRLHPRKGHAPGLLCLHR